MAAQDTAEDLRRIREGLERAAEAVRPYTPGSVAWGTKAERGDPITAADLAIDRVLRETLPRGDEGWLSEETVDDHARLGSGRVWIIDPVDGTREFVEGIPEWCVSIGLVENGRPLAGGILNPATGELVLGAVGAGVTLNGEAVVYADGSRPESGVESAIGVERGADPLVGSGAGSGGDSGDDLGTDSGTGAVGLEGARVLASRSEVKRGEWDRYSDAGFEVVPCGSVAYKLGQVAAGLADATWTLVPKHEWDVAGGAALIRAAGLHLCHADGSERTFNQPDTRLPNFLAGPARLLDEFRDRWVV